MTNESQKTGFGDSLHATWRSETKRHRVAKEIVRGWRSLTGDAKDASTLVACSGGADSSALAIALAGYAASERNDARIVLAHVIHDMRARTVALGDRDTVRELAVKLGVELVEAEIVIEQGSNAEASARVERYKALKNLAKKEGLPFVATAHHADDQFETVLMGLLRGSGPRGLRGVSAERKLGSSVTLIRPMLDITRDEIELYLRHLGVEWVEDATNQDTDKFRAGLRHGPVRDLLRMRPGSARRAARTAMLMDDVVTLIEARARRVFGKEFSWDRKDLASEVGIVIAEGLRRAALKQTNGKGEDRLTGEVLDAVVDAVKDESGESRSFDWPLGITVEVTKSTVSMSRENA
ncbi:MAG: tRNA lysidine(34) synthetase TilS [Phycisphaerales bacterium]